MLHRLSGAPFNYALLNLLFGCLQQGQTKSSGKSLNQKARIVITIRALFYCVSPGALSGEFGTCELIVGLIGLGFVLAG